MGQRGNHNSNYNYLKLNENEMRHIKIQGYSSRGREM